MYNLCSRQSYWYIFLCEIHNRSPSINESQNAAVGTVKNFLCLMKKKKAAYSNPKWFPAQLFGAAPDLSHKLTTKAYRVNEHMRLTCICMVCVTHLSPRLSSCFWSSVWFLSEGSVPHSAPGTSTQIRLGETELHLVQASPSNFHRHERSARFCTALQTHDRWQSQSLLKTMLFSPPIKRYQVRRKDSQECYLNKYLMASCIRSTALPSR